MSTCKTCKHWLTASDRLGTCARWLTGYRTADKDVGDNEVLVEDDEGWAAVMGPDFGCVLHEEAEAK
jgi:hypothetical protein